MDKYETELGVALAVVHRASVLTKDVMVALRGDHFDKADASEVTYAITID